MVIGTLNQPPLPFDVQKQLWGIRREYAKLAGFKFTDELEERFMATLSADEATKEVAEAEAHLAAFKDAEAKKRRKNEGRKHAQPSSDDERAHSAGDENRTDNPDPEPKGDDAKPLGSEPSDDSFDDSNADGHERKRTSRGDRARVRSHKPRIETGGGSKELFKMTRLEKYSGEKDNDRAYEAVQLFPSQLS